MDEQNHELARSIRREVSKLSEQWNHLINRSDNWKHRLDEYMTVSFYYFELFKIVSGLEFLERPNSNNHPFRISLFGSNSK
jgi:hypothetical protein